MKQKNLLKRAFCFALAIFMSLFCSVAAFAVDIDGDGIDDDITQYENSVTVAQPEPESDPEPATETPATEAPVTEAPQEPVYTEPPTESEYVEPETEAEPTEEIQPETQAQIQYVETLPDNTTDDGFQIPTLPKTISTKSYSTNYLAGFVSWICVIIGVIVVSAVIISTKAGGRKNRNRQQYY